MALEPGSGAGSHDDGDHETLPCGASLIDLWESGVPHPGHSHCHCQHCRTALDELAALQQVVQESVDQELAIEPRAEAAAIADRVMEVVRTELRPGRLLPLGEVSEDNWVTEAAAARVLRAAAERLPGVAAGSCRIRSASATDSARLPRPGARLPRGPLQVRMELAVSPTWSVPDVVTALRRLVSASARDDLGLDLAGIDVVVVDLLDQDPDSFHHPGEEGP